METRLGVRLLARTTRSLAPTEAGERLLNALRPRFEKIEAELAAVCELRDKPAGTIRITATERERLIGRWGVASFHDEKDRKRTEAQTRSQCGQAYATSKGPTNGVMMHVADDPERYELRLKGDAAGRTYLGFEAPPGHPQDREILCEAPHTSGDTGKKTSKRCPAGKHCGTPSAGSTPSACHALICTAVRMLEREGSER